MKAFKRILSFLLLLSMVLSLAPMVQIAKAAETVYRYELDTDGIDPGATYLIVNTSAAGSANAMMFYYKNRNQADFRNQKVTIQSDDGVTYIDTGFSSEGDCQFQFSAAAAGN